MFQIIRWKLLTTIVLLALGAVALYPSFKLYRMPAETRYGTEPQLEELRDKSLKLGLDLLGGMHLVLELDKSNLTEEQAEDAMDRAMEILRNRIDQFGVAEPTLQPQGDDRIIIELPGLLDKQRALDLIGQTALLEFKLVKDANGTAAAIERLDRAIAAARSGAAPDTSDSLAAPLGDTPLLDALFNFPDFSQFGGAIIAPGKEQEVEDMLALIDRKAVVPTASIAITSKGERLGTGTTGKVLYVLEKDAELTGASISNAVMQIGLDATRPTEAGVSMTMNASGANAFRRITGRNVGKQLAIVLDEKVASAPFIRDRIPSGRASIHGSFTDAEARDLAIVLRAGALPAPVKIVEERTVGPSLGSDSIKTGVNAALVGSVAVIIFMVIYYQLSGFIAVLALVLNIFFLMAGLAVLRGTLTLPGIAGIVLTVGMAVDANVLIFERIREELRAGRKVRAAIDAGYQRAFQTILDANVTTLISSAVLFQFGTGPIKGFAITLGIGIIANLFTAVLVTRMIFDAVTINRNVDRLSI